MAVANEIYGGMSVSKLFMNVREKKSLCYYCHSAYRSDRGTMRVECGVAPQNCDAAIDEISHQLCELKAGNITHYELETAKRTLISGFIQSNDNPAALTTFDFRRLLAGVVQTCDDCIREINAVTMDQVIAAAAKIKLDTIFVLEGCDNDCDGGEDYE